MEFSISWTRRARTALREIFDYIAQDNRPAAETLRTRILSQTKLLATTPRIGPRYAGEQEREVRQLIEGNYRIFYEVDESQTRVIILTVWHGARREPDFL